MGKTHFALAALSREDGWNRLLRYAGHWSLLGYGLFAVFEKETGDFVGETGLADFHRGLGAAFDASPEAAWIFAGRAQGRGYATEAVTAVHGWNEQRRPGRTVCIIHPDNQPSLRLAARLGYALFDERVYKERPYLLIERAGQGGTQGTRV